MLSKVIVILDEKLDKSGKLGDPKPEEVFVDAMVSA